MTYVDGFLIPVPKAKLAAYRKMARLGAKTWMKNGALEYKECVLDDAKNVMPDGTAWPSLIPKMAGLKRGETLVFAFIVFKSKAHRDAVNKRVMADPGMQGMDPKAMPFDMKRFGYAGFKTLVEA